MLQWGRRLSTTETWTDPSTATAHIYSFNGAVVFQRRRLDLEVSDRGVTINASMGPSSFNDGDGAERGNAEVTTDRFNGAVVFQRRRPG